jgi:hypothetical protein
VEPINDSNLKKVTIQEVKQALPYLTDEEAATVVDHLVQLCLLCLESK